MERFKTIWLLYAITLFILTIYAVYIPFNSEGLTHYNCLSFAEAFHTAKVSYLRSNPRLGEMFTYFMGHNARLFYIFIHPVLSLTSILLIYRLATGQWPDSTIKSVTTYLFIFVSFLGFNSDTYWFMANMNWLYPSTLVLAFFCLVEGFFKGNFQLSTKRLWFAVPLAFAAGMSNQNFAIVSWLLLFGCGVYHIFIRKRSGITWQYLLLFALLTIACLTFYLAPGNAKRIEMENMPISLNSIITHSLLNVGNWGKLAICLWRLCMAGVVLFFIKIVTRSSINYYRFLGGLLTAFMLWGVILVTPTWGAPRAFLPIELMITSTLALLFFSIKFTNLIRFALLGVYMLLMSTQIIPVAGILVSSNREWNRIEKMAEMAKSQGHDFLVVRSSQLDFSSSVSQLGDFSKRIFNYTYEPVIPLIPTNEHNTLHTNHKHEWVKNDALYDTEEGYGYQTGDHIMNPIAAKKLGLKAVYYIEDK